MLRMTSLMTSSWWWFPHSKHCLHYCLHGCYAWRHWWRHFTAVAMLQALSGNAALFCKTGILHLLLVAMLQNPHSNHCLHDCLHGCYAWRHWWRHQCCGSPIATIVYTIVYMVATVAKDRCRIPILHLLVSLMPIFAEVTENECIIERHLCDLPCQKVLIWPILLRWARDKHQLLKSGISNRYVAENSADSELNQVSTTDALSSLR